MEPLGDPSAMELIAPATHVSFSQFLAQHSLGVCS
jgi:hypothetical protein